MRTGIVVALPQEQRTLRCLAGDPRFAIELGGPGPANARRAAESLLAAGCERILSWGIAGAISEALHSGDLMEPARVRAVDSERTFDIVDARSDAALVSTPVLTRSSDKAALRALGASLVDMESHAIGTACAEKGADFHVCRAVVDTADAQWIDAMEGLVDHSGHVRPVEVLKGLFQKPGSLVAAARANRKALASLERRARVLKETGR